MHAQKIFAFLAMASVSAAAPQGVVVTVPKPVNCTILEASVNEAFATLENIRLSSVGVCSSIKATSLRETY